MKMYLGREHTAPCILNLGTRWNGQLHALVALPPWKEPWYPLVKRLGGPQSQSGCSTED